MDFLDGVHAKGRGDGVMRISQVAEFLMGVFIDKDVIGDHKDREVKARLLWRDKDGCVRKVQYASMGYGSPNGLYFTVEMNEAEEANG